MVLLPSVLRDQIDDADEAAAFAFDPGVGMEAGVSVMEELAAESFRLVPLALRKLSADEASAYAVRSCCVCGLGSI